jgi:hypothetical protein
MDGRPTELRSTQFTKTHCFFACYFFAPGIMLLNRAIKPGWVAVAAKGLAGTAAETAGAA